MAIHNFTRRWGILSLFTSLLALSIIVIVHSQQEIINEGEEEPEIVVDSEEDIDYGNHNENWEDGPSSWEEFGHENDPDVCGLPRITVEEWEAKRYWEGKYGPVIVMNVTDGWAALNNWKK